MNKPRGRPFLPGNKFGRGRPKGSRNREKSPGQHLLDEWTPHLVRKLISMAMQGSLSAMRLCMERISPALRGAGVVRDAKGNNADPLEWEIQERLRAGRPRVAAATLKRQLEQGRLDSSSTPDSNSNPDSLKRGRRIDHLAEHSTLDAPIQVADDGSQVPLVEAPDLRQE